MLPACTEGALSDSPCATLCCPHGLDLTTSLAVNSHGMSFLPSLCWEAARPMTEAHLSWAGCSPIRARRVSSPGRCLLPAKGPFCFLSPSMQLGVAVAGRSEWVRVTWDNHLLQALRPKQVAMFLGLRPHAERPPSPDNW